MCIDARRRRRAPRALSVALALAAALAAGCAPAPRLDMPERRAPGFAGPLPPMQSFTAAPARPTARGNRQLAQDFLELSFEMESGRALPRFTRFEGPVRVALRGPADAQLSRDLDDLLARLRREAGIDIARARPGTPANLVVEVLPRRQLQRAVPEAACFVVPRVTSWEAFRDARRSRQVDWTTLEERTAAAVFLPGDVSPQEARDCLHEEIAQALGPLNDLYRLHDSVFNDDNFHAVLTGFDMLMLRITYDPALQSGLSRAEVASRLPGILARANPAGAGGSGPLDAPSPRDWIRAIETALGPRGRPAPRRAAAREAVEIADREGWRDGRRAFSLYVYGRLALGEEPERALQAFLEAASIYAERPEMAVQRAHVGMQLAAFSLTAGRLDAAVDIVDAHAGTVREAENAALLATLLLIKAEALAAGGETARAEGLRREALGWARYGFGADEIVRARAGEIARLAPRRVEG
jgi:hypothetical protein